MLSHWLLYIEASPNIFNKVKWRRDVRRLDAIPFQVSENFVYGTLYQLCGLGRVNGNAFGKRQEDLAAGFDGLVEPSVAIPELGMRL